jgi:probable rRNA maturation factor
VTVHLRSEHPRGREAAARLRGRARHFLSAMGRPEAELSVLLTSDRAVRALNRRWRGVDRSTDVLSFPLSEPPGMGPVLGDVVLSMDTAARRARAEGRQLAEELERYLVHGLLHLLGYDHDSPREARRMARREEDLVRAEGLVGAALRRGA